MTGQKPSALDFPDMPDELSHIWQYYLDIRNAGEVNYSTIQSFSQLMCADLKPFEVSLIMEFEREYRRAM